MTTLTLRTPEDLIGWVPSLLGFHPHDSLVLIVTSPRVFAARVDIPEDSAEITNVASMLAEAVMSHSDDDAKLFLLAYTDDPTHARRFAAVFELLTGKGINVQMRVHDGRFYIGDDDNTGHPFGTSRILAEAVFSGRNVAGSREERSQLIAPLAERISLDDAHFERQVPGDGDTYRRLAAKRIIDSAGRWLADGFTDTRELAEVVVACTDVAVRDVLWAQITHENAARWCAVLSDASRVLPEEPDSASFPALAAFAAWLSGDGALAWMCLDRANELDPDYTLNGSIAAALTSAMSPHTWKPLTADRVPLLAG